MSSRVFLDAYGISDVGLVKDVNEDSFVYKIAEVNGNLVGLFAVADGVGGLSEGDKASKTCISRINLWWDKELERYSKQDDMSIDINELRKAIEDAGERISSNAGSRGIKSGTTLTMMATCGDKAVIAHVGDSRCYRYYKSFLWHLTQLTTDHSCKANKLVNGVNVVKSVLTDCIGYKKDFRIDITETELKEGEFYLFCSDGIYKTQTDADIEDIFKQNRKDLKVLCERLVEGAKENNEKDNISVIVMEVKSLGKVNK